MRQVLGATKEPVSARGAGALRSVAASAIWTNTRLVAAGYAVSGRCPMCRNAPDTLHHRWWECPASQVERDRLASQEQQARARAAGPTSVLYSRAILEHPGETWAPPSPEPQTVLQHRGPEGEGITHAAGQEDWSVMKGPGELFVDGSCTTHPIAECRRAAWAVVRVLANGTRVAWCRGAVPSDWPQSAQAAEYFAAGAAGQVATKNTVIRSDCLNVVQHFNADVAKQLSRRRRYAGVVRSARGCEGATALRSLRKVAVHVNVAECTTEFENCCAEGNGAADEQAKLGLGLHPGQSSQARDQWAREWLDATTTAKIIAAVGPRWPAVRPPDGRRLPRPQRRARIRAERATHEAQKEQARQEARASHSWAVRRGLRRCTACGAPFSKAGAAAALCPGRQQAWADLVENPQSHELYIAAVERPPEQRSPLILCTRCGVWAESGSSPALAERCKGRPTPSAREVIRRVRTGQHPKCGERGGAVAALFPLATVVEAFDPLA